MYGKNDEQVLQVFQSSLDAGDCFFDTAEAYGFGKSERLLGECLMWNERQAVIASKFIPLPTRQLNKALDASLSRLGLQTLDVYHINLSGRDRSADGSDGPDGPGWKNPGGGGE